MEAGHLLNVQMMTLKPQAGGLVQGNGPGWYRGWVILSLINPLLLQKWGWNRFLLLDVNERFYTGAISLVFL